MALKKTLDTPYDISGTVSYLRLDSFALNVEDGLVHIGYSTVKTDDTYIQRDIPYTLTGQDYVDFLARVNTLAETYSATQAIQAACLEYLPGDGTIGVI